MLTRPPLQVLIAGRPGRAAQPARQECTTTPGTSPRGEYVTVCEPVCVPVDDAGNTVCVQACRSEWRPYA